MSRSIDAAPQSRLALRQIEGNLCFTADEAWAWFVLPTQLWAFRSDGQREQLMLGFADGLSWLAGHRVHVRVTSRPYPTASWARRLDELTTAPLAITGGKPWPDHLVDMQRHLRTQTMAEKEVYLGVRVRSRAPSHRLMSTLLRRPTDIEHARLLPEVERIAEAVALPGLDGRPAAAAEMEWLVRRSSGLGLPSPQDLSPVEQQLWTEEDLATFEDRVEYEAPALGRTVKLTSRTDRTPVERHVAVLSVGRLEEMEAPDPAHEPWLSHTDRLPFPVEWSAQFDVLAGNDARRTIQRKLLVVRDMQKHYAEHDLDEPLALDRQARHAREVEDQMTRGADVASTRIHGWFRIAVAGRTEEECLERARKVVSSYRSRRVTIEHPRGQFGLLREFIPGESVSTVAYRRRLPALYVAAGVPAASSRLGDRRGPYIGYTAGASARAVMFDTHYATEVRETSGLVPVVGGLGAGKSVLLGQIAYSAVRRGIPSIILDPSGPLSRLTQLPDLAAASQHIDLTTAASGTLNPFEVVATPARASFADDDAHREAEVLAAQDRKLLAMDVIKMLLPASVDAMPQTALVVSEAVRSTRGDAAASLWDVVTHLEGMNNPHGKVVADYLRDMAELPLSRLFFPSTQGAAPRLSATLTVLTMPGLVLPPRSVPRDHWSTSEQLAVPLLHLASWFATRAVYGRTMHERKLVALDETHFLGEWSAGRALFSRLGRDSRKWNTCVLAASQNPTDILGMDVANFMSAAFVGRLEDDETARDGLRMLRVPTGVGYERVLSTLSSGRGDSQFREFVMRDVDGNVDKLRIDLTGNPDLLAALNTTAAQRGSEDVA
ncbi:ATP-binding protein [Nocardioides bruguierae]|uniref:ATP-binding protein n=1 Tax=Nocardioides bruguierae TaxID=2945102 RepID=A0A9X2DBA8_9ACTN|nr:ATP-binding protein [Nocardioides bruguierae]MCM0622535.1 ATP-binding protein [Nocardioides bruguierae]